MAADKPLAFVQNGQAIIRVDNWTTLASGQPRNRCVRLVPASPAARRMPHEL